MISKPPLNSCAASCPDLISYILALFWAGRRSSRLKMLFETHHTRIRKQYARAETICF